jgi:hypothetical protein
VDVSPAGVGQRRVTVTTTSNPSFGAHALTSIRFDELRRAEIEAPGQPATSAVPLTLTVPAGATQATFVIRRTAAGELMARFTVTDSCGAWPTFVGAGPDAGW